MYGLRFTVCGLKFAVYGVRFTGYVWRFAVCEIGLRVEGGLSCRATPRVGVRQSAGSLWTGGWECWRVYEGAVLVNACVVARFG